MSQAERTVRARYGDGWIVVYQAYGRAIAEAALDAGRFVSPFKFDRMTWIKPSFLWMMYRSDWGRRKEQERVLAVTISRQGFEWALGNSCLSHFDSKLHGSREQWARDLKDAAVRVQWDPDRSLAGERLSRRAIQIGLSSEAVQRYVREWIQGIEDVSDRVAEMCALVESGRIEEGRSKLPDETPYPLPADVAARVGCGLEGMSGTEVGV